MSGPVLALAHVADIALFQSPIGVLS